MTATIEDEREVLRVLKDCATWGDADWSGQHYCVPLYFEDKESARRMVAALEALNK